MVRHGESRCGSVWQVEARHDKELHSLSKHGSAWCSSEWYGKARPGRVGRGKESHSSNKRGMVWQGSVRHGALRHGLIRSGRSRQGKARKSMPKSRQPREIWQGTRERIWLRDKGRCQGPYCLDKPEWSIGLKVCHIDHIRSGKFGSNSDSNLRVLCRFCHVLRLDHRHRGMIAQALKDGIIPPNWRELVWE